MSGGKQHKIQFVIEGHDKNGAKVTRQNAQEIGKFEESLKRASLAQEGLRAAQAAALAGQRQISDSVSRITESVRVNTEALDANSVALGSWAGIAAGTGAAAMVALGVSQANATKQIVAMSDALGMSSSELSAFAYVANDVGLSLDAALSLAKDTAEKVGEAAEFGSGEAIDALKGLGLSADQLAKKSPVEMILAIGDAMSRVESESAKSAVLEMFGNDLTLLIPKLRDGAAGYHQMAQQGRDLNAVMSDADMSAIADMSDAVGRLADAGLGEFNQTLATVAPAVEVAATAIADHIGVVSAAATGLSIVVAGRLTSSLAGSAAAMVAAEAATQKKALADLAAAKAAEAKALAASRAALSEQAAAQRVLDNARVQKLAGTAAIDRSKALGVLAAANQRVIATETALAAATENTAKAQALASRGARAASFALGALGGPVGLAVTAGLTAMTFAMGSQADEAEDLRGELNQLMGSVDGLTKAQARQQLQNLGPGLEKAKDAAAEYQEEIDSLKAKMDALGDPFELWGGQAKSYEIWRKELINAEGNLDTAKQAVDDYMARQKELQGVLDGTAKATDNATGSGEASAGQTVDQKKKVEELIAALRLKKKQLDDDSVALLKYKLAQQGATEKQIKLALAELKAVEAKEAKIAADKKAAQAAKTLAGQHEKAIEALEAERIGLEKGAEAARIYRLEQAGFGSAQIAEQMEIWKKVEALKAEEQARKDAAKASDKATEAAAKNATKVADLAEESAKRIDAVFADAWMNLDGGFEDLLDGMTDGFKRMLAEMAHDAITRPIIVDIQSSMGLGSGAGGAASSASSLLSLGSDIPGMSGVTDWLGSTSISQNIAQYTGFSPGLSGAAAAGPTADIGSAFAGNTGVAGPTNLQMGVAGIAGGLGANLIFGGKGQSGLGGSLGSSVGMYALGPWGAALGMLLGGGFGSLFGGRDPKFDFRTRQAGDDFRFEDEDHGVYAQGAFGEIGFDADGTRKLKSTFDGFENAEAFLDTIALIDNAIGGLAQSDAELLAMADSVAALEIKAKSPSGILEQMSDRWLLALSKTTSRLTDGISVETEQLTRRLGWETENGTRLGDGVEDYGTVTVAIETALMQAIYDLEPDQMIAAMSSIISMERVGDAIGGAVTDDLYASLEAGIADGLDVTAVVDQLNGALTALPSLAQFNDRFDLLAAGALEASGNIVELAGGLHSLSAQQAQYYDLYFTEEEKFADYAAQMTQSMGDLGFGLVDSHEGFRDLVEGLNLTTAAGQEQYAGLMALAPAMDKYLTKIEAEQAAKEKVADDMRKSYLSLTDLLDSAVNPLSSAEQALVSANSAMGALGLTGKTYEEALEWLEDFDADQLVGLADQLGLSFVEIQDLIKEIIAGNNEVSGGGPGGGTLSLDKAEDLVDAANTAVWQHSDIINEYFDGVVPSIQEFNDVFSDVDLNAGSSLSDITSLYDDVIDFIGGLPDDASDLRTEWSKQSKGLKLVSPVGDIAESIGDIYDEFLGRLPDQSGLEYWLEQYKNGVSLDEIQADIAGGIESALHANSDINGALFDAFDQYLGRLPTQSELNQYFSEIVGDVPAGEVLGEWVSGLDLSGALGSVITGLASTAEAEMFADLKALETEYSNYQNNKSNDKGPAGLGAALIALDSATEKYNDALAESQKTVTGTTNAVSSANYAESQRQSLLQQWYTLTNNEVELRKMQLAGLDATNHALQQQIWAYEDAEEARQALNDRFAFDGDIADQIARIGMSAEELAYADLDKQFDEWIKQAEEVGGDLANVEKLYGLRRAEIAAEYAEQAAEAAKKTASVLVEDAGLNDYLQSVADYVESESDLIRDAAQEQVDLLEAWRDTAQDLRDYVEQLRISELSPLGPAQKLAEAQESFAALFVKAEAGDIAAAGQLSGAADAYLNLADAYYGRSDAYSSIFFDVSDSLDQLGIDLLATNNQEAIEQINREMAADIDALKVYAQRELSWSESQAYQLTGISDSLGEWPGKFDAMLGDLAGDIGAAVAAAMPDRPAAVSSAPYSPDRNGSYWDLKAAQSVPGSSSVSISYAPDKGRDFSHFKAKPVSASVSLDGSHADGLWRVPFDRYLAELHEDEMVVPARPAEHLRDIISAAGPRKIMSGGGVDMAPLLAEIRELKESNQRLESIVDRLLSEQSGANANAANQRDQIKQATDSAARANRKTPVPI